MKFTIDRDRIMVTPETKQDEAYIEDTLGLLHDGESVQLIRRNAMGLGCIAYLEARKSFPSRLQPVGSAGREQAE